MGIKQVRNGLFSRLLLLMGRVDAGAAQASPVLFGTEAFPGDLRVNCGIRGGPAEQSIEGKQNRGCNRNQDPPVHAAPSTEALACLVVSLFQLPKSNHYPLRMRCSENLAAARTFANELERH